MISMLVIAFNINAESVFLAGGLATRAAFIFSNRIVFPSY
jgi:hypothetical protein